MDFRGTVADVVSRIEKLASEDVQGAVSPERVTEAPRGPGRPRLGVVARGHAAAAALGLAERSTRGCIGRAAEAGGRSPAHE